MVTSGKRDGVVVDAPRNASPRQQEELGAFARHCIHRIEKELGTHDRWAIRISTTASGYTSYVEVHHLGVMLEMSGTGADGELATLDAMVRVEQLLRERRG
ncbi:MAG: hypothetical protein H0T42_10455 [Deltaproteobacteria bacterium]|nr:hypothetical protein [Deltaproteobacteria bacterium]